MLGHLLATRRALFDDLGGFDREFRTAVYAFADYSFRTRGRGLRTCYAAGKSIRPDGAGARGERMCVPPTANCSVEAGAPELESLPACGRSGTAVPGTPWRCLEK